MCNNMLRDLENEVYRVNGLIRRSTANPRSLEWRSLLERHRLKMNAYLEAGGDTFVQKYNEIPYLTAKERG